MAHPFARLLLPCVLAAGCRVYDPALADRDAADVPDTHREEPDAAALPSRRPPPPPPATTEGTSIGPRIFALRDLDIDQHQRWRDIGFDLDGRTTSAETNWDAECTSPRAPRVPADGNDGIDNVLGGLVYPAISLVRSGLQEEARAAMESGLGLPILWLTDWNGQPEDPQVRVAITTAVIGTSAQGPDADSPPNARVVTPRILEVDGMPAPPPAWDGRDWFWVRSDTLAGGDLDTPRFVADDAYVVGGRLVANLPAGMQLIFPSSDLGLEVTVNNAFVVADLGDGTALDNVVIAGRWGTTDLLATAENLGICPGTSAYTQLQSMLQTNADIRRAPPTGGAVLTCDAISIGIGFTGTRIRVAAPAQGLDVVSQCGMDAGVDARSFSDAGLDAAVDARTEAPRDAGVDVGRDAGVRDVGTDVGADAP